MWTFTGSFVVLASIWYAIIPVLEHLMESWTNGGDGEYTGISYPYFQYAITTAAICILLICCLSWLFNLLREQYVGFKMDRERKRE